MAGRASAQERIVLRNHVMVPADAPTLGVRQHCPARFLPATINPRRCMAQTSLTDATAETRFGASLYGGIVLAANDNVTPSPGLYLIGAQFSLRRPPVEWVVFEPFGLFSSVGPGIEGGLQTALNVSAGVHGPYVGVGGAVLSPHRGGVAYITGRVGMRPLVGEMGLRVELQYLHRVGRGSFDRLVDLLIGLDVNGAS